jgi:Reverse transcriptase (RNA-dependent DNA polymerase)
VERCPLKLSPIAGSKLYPQDAGRELYDIFGNIVGSVWSPLLANLLLDGLDKELERRGHRFVRYADDCNIYVKSARAGQRVLTSVTRFLARRLKLAVNAAKSAVDRPWRRTFLGFTFTGRRPNRRRVSEKALKACKQEVRRLTARTRGARRRGWGVTCGSTAAAGTPTLASPKHRPASRNWTPGCGVGYAATGGSRGAGGSIASCVAVG